MRYLAYLSPGAKENSLRDPFREMLMVESTMGNMYNMHMNSNGSLDPPPLAARLDIMREYAFIDTTTADEMQQQIDDGVTALGFQLLGPVKVVMIPVDTVLGKSDMVVKYYATMYREI